MELTEEAMKELEEDFTSEMNSVTKFKSLIVITKEKATLGAELGSIFVEFWNEKCAQQGVKKVKGRIYDGCEIKTCYIEESLYNEHFFPDAAEQETNERDVQMQAPQAKADLPADQVKSSVWQSKFIVFKVLIASKKDY